MIIISVLVRFWQMHRWTPFVQHFPQRHLGSTIALKLDSMLEALELTDPEVLRFCVNDNASNMQCWVLLKTNPL